MSDSRDTENLVMHIRKKMDEGLESIDAATRSKITQARYQALEGRRRTGSAAGWLVGAVTSAALALLVYIQVSTPVPDEVLLIDDLEMISNIDDLEFLEDLEFYEWLEQHELPT